MLREPVTSVVDAMSGAMSGNTGRYEKRLSDLEGLYEDATAYADLIRRLGNPVVYEVEDFRPGDHAGDLIYGVTRMSPGLVGREFFLTRGHIHAKADRPEIYYGQAGKGLMQLESPEGETRIVEIGPQTICYVPPYWIHRSINVGDDDLVMHVWNRNTKPARDVRKFLKTPMLSPSNCRRRYVVSAKPPSN